MYSNLSWTDSNIQRCRLHSGNRLQCFNNFHFRTFSYIVLFLLQDKFRYLDLCKDICIPSFTIQRSELSLDGTLTPELKWKIRSWASKHYEIGRKSLGGWVVKCPFSTGTLSIIIWTAILNHSLCLALFFTFYILRRICYHINFFFLFSVS